MAYGLGYSAYQDWRRGSASNAAKAIEYVINDTLLYMNGLQLLGLDCPDDMQEAFCRLFELLPACIARAEEIVLAGVGRRYHDYSVSEIESLPEMIAEIQEQVE